MKSHADGSEAANSEQVVRKRAEYSAQHYRPTGYPVQHGVLGLQRLAGNVAVSRLLATSSHGTESPHDVGLLRSISETQSPYAGGDVQQRLALRSFIESCPRTKKDFRFGYSTFDVWFQPPVLWTNINVRFNFQNGSMKDYPEANPLDLHWDEASKASYVSDWIKIVKDVWKPGVFTFYCQRRGWEELKATVVPEFTSVASSPHYDATVIKIPKGKTKRSDVDWLRGKANFHSSDVLREGRPIIPGTDRRGNLRQRLAPHEAGHMLGLGDEYVDPKRGRHEGDIVTQGLTKVVVKNTNSIMSMGETVLEAHSGPFISALRSVTGVQEWSVSQKGSEKSLNELPS